MLVQVGLEYRYMPPVAKLIEIVKSRALGQVKMVAIREHRFPFLVKVYYENLFSGKKEVLIQLNLTLYIAIDLILSCL